MSRMKRWKMITAIVAGTVVLVAAGGAAAYAIRKQIIISSACADIERYLAEEGAVQTVGSGATRISVLGDSYVAGDMLGDRSERWVNALAAIEDVTVTFDGIGGTGFVNGGCTKQPFDARTAVLTEPADIVIISGGLNDLAAKPAAIRAAADRTLDAVAPGARVFLVGPTSTPARGDVAWVDAELRAAAEAHGATFVAASGWDLPYLSDETHLTPDGHAQYAGLVADAVLR